MFMFVRVDPFSRDRPMALSSQLGQLVRRANHHSIEIRIFLPFCFHCYVKAGLHARMRASVIDHLRFAILGGRAFWSESLSASPGAADVYASSGAVAVYTSFTARAVSG